MAETATLDGAIALWYQAAASLPNGSRLRNIDSQRVFSASNAPREAALFLRAVHLPGHGGGISRNEGLRDALVRVRLVDDASLAKVRDTFGWDWPAIAPRQSGTPSTPAGRRTMPANHPPRPKLSMHHQMEYPTRHDLFLDMVSDMKMRAYDAEADWTQPISFDEALGAFGHAWIKFRRMEDGLHPQLSPPRLQGHARSRGIGLFCGGGMPAPDNDASPVPRRMRSYPPPLLPNSTPGQDTADTLLLKPMERLALGTSSSNTSVRSAPEPASDTPMQRSESLMVEFLAEFINSLSLSCQLFNHSKFPTYVSESHQRRFIFGPGRNSKNTPNGSFTARVDGYISRPGRPGTGVGVGLVDLQVWIIHEVKQHVREDAGDQLKRQEMCEFAAWAYEMRDALHQTVRQTSSPVWLPLLALDRTQFWFQLARVTEDWLDYVSDPDQPVMRADGQPLPPDSFLQIYEYGPFEVHTRQSLMTVGIAVLAMIFYDIHRHNAGQGLYPGQARDPGA